MSDLVTWEYDLIEVSHDEEGRRERFTEMLRAHGRAGWELVAVVPANQFVLHYFKRPRAFQRPESTAGYAGRYRSTEHGDTKVTGGPDVYDVTYRRGTSTIETSLSKENIAALIADGLWVAVDVPPNNG